MREKKQTDTQISKKEIQRKIRGILMGAIGLLGIKVASKKLKKEVKETSKKVGERLVQDLKKLSPAKRAKSAPKKDFTGEKTLKK